jgi:hypothetical protein
MGVLHAPFIADDDRFTEYAKAIEVLHHGEFGTSEAAEAERDERVQRALDALPFDLVEWATPLLEQSTPPIARHRLMEVVRALGAAGEAIVGGDVEAFALRAVMTRNFITHRSDNAAKKAVYGIQRLWHMFALGFLAQGTVHELPQRLGREARFSTVAAELADYYGPAVTASGTEGG